MLILTFIWKTCCRKVRLSKYYSRNSPTVHASQCADGAQYSKVACSCLSPTLGPSTDSRSPVMAEDHSASVLTHPTNGVVVRPSSTKKSIFRQTLLTTLEPLLPLLLDPPLVNLAETLPPRSYSGRFRASWPIVYWNSEFSRVPNPHLPLYSYGP